MPRRSIDKGFCPGCLKESPLRLIRRREEIVVRGETFRVWAELFRCEKCGEEFQDLKSSVDPLDAAYRQYRHKHGLMQPEGIVRIRLDLLDRRPDATSARKRQMLMKRLRSLRASAAWPGSSAWEDALAKAGPLLSSEDPPVSDYGAVTAESEPAAGKGRLVGLRRTRRRRGAAV